jgi:hypothetical protein
MTPPPSAANLMTLSSNSSSKMGESSRSWTATPKTGGRRPNRYERKRDISKDEAPLDVDGIDGSGSGGWVGSVGETAIFTWSNGTTLFQETKTRRRIFPRIILYYNDFLALSFNSSFFSLAVEDASFVFCDATSDALLASSLARPVVVPVIVFSAT